MADKRSFLMSVVLAGGVLLLDQWSKWLVLRDSPPEINAAPMDITPFFAISKVWNTGISFGMFAGHRQPYLLVALSLVIVSILLKWMYKNTSPWVAAGLGFIIGGALGNVVDRLRFKAVMDFFDAHIGPYHWPAFNIADSAIFIGVVLLCLSSMIRPQEKIS